jgi:hypothetical protein
MQGGITGSLSRGLVFISVNQFHTKSSLETYGLSSGLANFSHTFKYEAV